MRIFLIIWGYFLLILIGGGVHFFSKGEFIAGGCMLLSGIAGLIHKHICEKTLKMLEKPI